MFRIILIGFIKGAENIEAPVAAINPTLPSSSIKYDIPNKNPNLGTLLNPTPTIRGPKPDIEALNGDFLKIALA